MATQTGIKYIDDMEEKEAIARGLQAAVTLAEEVAVLTAIIIKLGGKHIGREDSHQTEKPH